MGKLVACGVWHRFSGIMPTKSAIGATKKAIGATKKANAWQCVASSAIHSFYTANHFIYTYNGNKVIDHSICGDVEDGGILLHSQLSISCFIAGSTQCFFFNSRSVFLSM
jgi:hypothetical protein